MTRLPDGHMHTDDYVVLICCAAAHITMTKLDKLRYTFIDKPCLSGDGKVCKHGESVHSYASQSKLSFNLSPFYEFVNDVDAKYGKEHAIIVLVRPNST